MKTKIRESEHGASVIRRASRIKKFKLNKETTEVIRIILILLTVFFLVYQVMEFVYAVHTIDTVYNANQLSLEFSQEYNKTINFGDRGSDFIERDLTIYYISAIKQLETSLFGALVFMSILTVLIVWRW